MYVGLVFTLIGLVIVIAGLVFTAFGMDRYRAKRLTGANPGMHATTEIFIDPVTQRRQRVWVDSRTGEREYRDE